MTRSTGHPTPHHATPRLFVAAALREGAGIAATPEQAHYLRTVLRRGPGDAVRVFNGADGEFLSHLGVTGRDVSLIVAHRLRPQQPEDGPWLVFALLKRDATDLVVRQAVELGASRLLPVFTERTNAARVNRDRLQAIAVEAAEQSERLTVPAIDQPARLESVLAAWPRDRHLFVALERSGAAPSPPQTHAGQAGLLIGPEGGFTPSERDRLARLDFVTPISLGPFVLRAETAAVAGQTLLLRMGWADYVPST